MPILTLTSEQLAAARELATQARRSRADFKSKVKAGKLSLPQALNLAKEDVTLGQVRVVDLLKCVPRVGDVRAERIMERLDIAPNRRIRGLGRLQLAALAEEFSGR